MSGMSELRQIAFAGGLLLASSAAALGPPITLTLDPVHPTIADRLTVRAHFDPDLCWTGGSSDTWSPPEITGRTIHLVNNAGVLELPFCSPPPEDYEVELPPLVEGSWSIVLQASNLESTRAVDVTAPSSELFLRGGRFVATATWRERGGQSNSANGVALDDAAGAFWFFDSSNVELTIKMLDGGGVNGKLWVFLASMTDVAYTVTVTDRYLVCITTPCPNTRTYEGVAGHNANVLDTSAFPAPSAAQAFR